jgi:hypothetical protein
MLYREVFERDIYTGAPLGGSEPRRRATEEAAG